LPGASFTGKDEWKMSSLPAHSAAFSASNPA